MIKKNKAPIRSVVQDFFLDELRMQTLDYLWTWGNIGITEYDLAREAKVSKNHKKFASSTYRRMLYELKDMGIVKIIDAPKDSRVFRLFTLNTENPIARSYIKIAKALISHSLNEYIEADKNGKR
jgi:hypothetical protein